MNPKFLVTHSGGFHADELCSSAVLSQLFPSSKIIRTRDAEWISPSEKKIIYDVGGDYCPEKRIFDHHQRQAPIRDSGAPYSSFGLIWRHYGKAYIQSLNVPADDLDAVFDAVDQEFVLPIDLLDNGAISPSTAAELAPLTLPSLLETLKPVFDAEGEDADDVAFDLALAIAKPLIKAQVMQQAAKRRARSLVFQAVEDAGQSRVLELPMGMPFRAVLDEAGADHLLFVVYPRKQGDWSIGGIRLSDDSFEQRADLPASWAGLTDEKLEQASGVSGATFCHNGLFIAAAKTREAILEMADLAVADALQNA
ncbi:hypothetical protein TRP8649_00760 [Pelagimonas phthalicica]|uniref:Metal-dependent hydrolase n=1 Tax=Pelagimonas phthalicica TaxID=1037362 RepID=A0A238J8F9_9RHOB|nr:MYG1 family protein [Pelagimonas phthalicica]TDS94796.1 uncharacterized UPF0160 family protein [Pelagimonas phthalicica]SMX26675.1 hypothetical protein TRP8649_00760 [Pelagimonas phthalicica]